MDRAQQRKRYPLALDSTVSSQSQLSMDRGRENKTRWPWALGYTLLQIVASVLRCLSQEKLNLHAEFPPLPKA
jgi:hypothetical protein